MSWNYRVIREQGADRTGVVWPKSSPRAWTTFTIREVYYDDSGKPDSFTDDACFPVGETPEELESDLQMMLLALTKPVLAVPGLTEIGG